MAVQAEKRGALHRVDGDTPPLKGLRSEPDRLQMGSCRNGVAWGGVCFSWLHPQPAAETAAYPSLRQLSRVSASLR